MVQSFCGEHWCVFQLWLGLNLKMPIFKRRQLTAVTTTRNWATPKKIDLNCMRRFREANFGSSAGHNVYRVCKIPPHVIPWRRTYLIWNLLRSFAPERRKSSLLQLPGTCVQSPPTWQEVSDLSVIFHYDHLHRPVAKSSFLHFLGTCVQRPPLTRSFPTFDTPMRLLHWNIEDIWRTLCCLVITSPFVRRLLWI